SFSISTRTTSTPASRTASIAALRSRRRNVWRARDIRRAPVCRPLAPIASSPVLRSLVRSIEIGVDAINEASSIDKDIDGLVFIESIKSLGVGRFLHAKNTVAG